MTWSWYGLDFSRRVEYPIGRLITCCDRAGKVHAISANYILSAWLGTNGRWILLLSIRNGYIVYTIHHNITDKNVLCHFLTWYLCFEDFEKDRMAVKCYVIQFWNVSVKAFFVLLHFFLPNSIAMDLAQRTTTFFILSVVLLLLNIQTSTA